MKMTNVVYIISDPPNEHMGRYKVGSWSRDEEALITRYITSHPELKIYYYVETSKALDVELAFKKLNKTKRVRNIRGRRSEWVVLPLDEIINQLNYLMNVDIDTLPIYGWIKIPTSHMYLDNFNYSSYDEIRSLNPLEAKILRQKFKQQDLSKEEAALLDKWFFVRLVKSDKLFNEWLLNRKTFFHIWLEKHPKLSVKLVNKCKKYYKCLNNLHFEQFNIIHSLNTTIGINHSCEPFQFYELAYDDLLTYFNNIIPHSVKYFDCNSDVNNIYEFVSKMLIKIYNYWCNADLVRIRYQLQVKYERSSKYMLKSEGNLDFYGYVGDSCYLN